MKRKKYDWTLLLLSIPCIISVIRYNLYKGSENMSFSSDLFMTMLPTICVIVIGIFNLRSGNKRIDEIGNDTKVILPKTANIEKNVEKYLEDTNRCITTDIKKTVEDIYDIADSDLKILVDEVNYKKRLKDEYANTFLRDNVVANIDKLYEENALFSNRIKELEIENKMLVEKVYKYQKLYEEERKKNVGIENKNERNFTM